MLAVRLLVLALVPHHLSQSLLQVVTLLFVSAAGSLTQLDLTWLHRLAASIASPIFQPPQSQFQTLEGPHHDAVLRLTAQQRNGLLQSSMRLMEANSHAAAIDVASQVGICSFALALL